MLTIIDKKVAVRVTNATESPYLIKWNTQIAEFPVVTPEQFMFINPADTAILSMILEGDPDLTTYLNELLRLNKPEQQNNIFRFPTTENPGKSEDHTPIQTRILKALHELKEKEKFNPLGDTESQTKFLESFDWTDTVFMEAGKPAIDDVLVDYRDIRARQRTDIGMITEFEVGLTPKNGEVVHSKSLWMNANGAGRRPKCWTVSDA